MSTDPSTEATGVGEGLRDRAIAALRACGVEPGEGGAAPLPVSSPIDGEALLELEGASAADALAAAAQAAEAFGAWRAAAPEDRAAAVGAIGRELDRRAPALAELIAIETGKLFAAAIAEVEAAVGACTRAADIATNVVPLPTPTAISAGRFEACRPLGPVAMLGAVEMPLLEWAAAAPFALACGCPVVWRPAAPLVATAVAALVDAALASSGSVAPAGLHSVVPGEADAAEALAEAPAIELVVRPRPAGANVAIVAPGADVDATAATLTAATLAGAGRSAASLHLVFAHVSIAPALEQCLVTAFAATIGDPLAPATALGPLRDLDAYRDHLDAVQTAGAEGGELLAGGEARDVDAFPSAHYVEPALIRAPALLAAVSTPVLFLATYTELDEALARRDTVARRWSALLGGTEEEAARFLAAPGSDRDFVAVGSCPTAADLEAPGADAWRTFTRPVAGRVGHDS